MMNLENAQLVLRSNSIVGTDNIRNYLVTWRSVNLRQVLGNMYDKYKLFKICLTSFGNVNTALTGSINSDRILQIVMSGLHFRKCGYNSGSFNPTSVNVGNCSVVANNFTTINYTGEIGQLFTVDQNMVIDITIELKRLNETAITNTVDYMNCIYCFTIYGVSELDN
jgi:hypothetical protein